MKSFILLTFLTLIVASLSKPITDEEMNAMIMQIVGSCKAKEGASDDDVAVVMSKDAPTTPEGKCLQTCIMEAGGIIQGGKLIVESTLERAAMLTGNDEASIEAVRQIATECESPNVANSCDVGPTIVKCILAAGERLGIDPRPFM